MTEAVILIKDLQGEKTGKVVGLKSAKNVFRGELLLSIPRNKIVPRKDGNPAHNYEMATNPGVTVFCTEDDIAPLSDHEYYLLAAVKSREDRYDVFQHDRLDWGAKLQRGDFAYPTLPSKSPVSSQRAISKIQFIGPLPNENGVWFGMEIMDPKHRDRGYTNGWFGGKQCFTCEENAGLFVSLDRLSPMPEVEPEVRPPTDRGQYQMMTRSRAQGGQPSQPDNQQQNQRNSSPTPKQRQFKFGDRVVTYDKKGAIVLGSVRWMGNVYNGVENIPAVGIETDVAVQTKDFLGALFGLGQHFKCSDSRHGKIVMPEVMVTLEREDAARREKQKQLLRVSSVDRGAEDIEREIQRAVKQNEQKKSSTRDDRNSQSHYKQIPGERFTSDPPPPHNQQQPSSHPGGAYDPSAESHDPGLSPPRSYHGDAAPVQGGPSFARPTVTHSFTMGSRVQLSSNPPRHGVIRWMGTLPMIHGQIAGVELEEPMDGCLDGVWQGSGVRYFSCRQGHSFFCPVSSLAPDQRLAETTSAGVNRTKELEIEVAQLKQALQKEKDMSAQLQLQLSEARVENQSLLQAQEESFAFGIESWKVPRDTVQVGRVIGGGGWASVNIGKLRVAVKQFYPNILSEKNILRLKREIRMLALVRHPNLLQFIAAVFDDRGDHENNPPYIITELLDDSLRSAYEKKLLQDHSLLAIFLDTARALDYLHRRYEPIIHRDVSSANVLLKRLPNDKWIAKLSDLGSANLAKEAYTMNEGARVYCAPEAFTFDTDARSAGTLTPKVDVYSYGIVLCEVTTRTFPEKDEYPKMLERLRRDWPQLHQLVLSCTKHSPEQRPSMATVLSQLEGFPPQQ